LSRSRARGGQPNPRGDAYDPGDAEGANNVAHEVPTPIEINLLGSIVAAVLSRSGKANEL
jgi:hypothetical protein